MKHISILLAALVLVLGVHALGRADAPAGVQKWEYKAIVFHWDMINALGDDDALAAAIEGARTYKPPTDDEVREQYASHDKNKDGTLSKADGPDWGGIGAMEALRIFDTDSDGKVTLLEYTTNGRLLLAYPLMHPEVVRAGMDGWELVSIGPGNTKFPLFFKRPVK